MVTSIRSRRKAADNMSEGRGMLDKKLIKSRAFDFV